MTAVTLHDTYQAARRIAPYVRNTPLIDSPLLAAKCGAAELYMKLESLQVTGAFKARGACNKIAALSESEKKRGVITFSTGNCGRAVAYMAARLGVKAVVCLSERVPHYRVASIEAVGGSVEQVGKSQDEAEAHYYKLIDRHGYIPVSPFDDPLIIAGQGTIAQEMLAEKPDIDTLIVQVSGGGLISGIAAAAKGINPRIKIIGASIKQSPAMLESLKAGKPVEIEEKPTLADSLSGGIGAENRYTLPMIRDLVDEHIVVTEDEIACGMAFLFKEHSLIAEGAASVVSGAIINGKLALSAKKAGLVISGGSIDTQQYLSVLNNRLKI